MKTTVIIEEGKTTIILKPENDFEIDILEKVHNNEKNYNIETEVLYKYDYGHKSDFSFSVYLGRKQP